MLEWFEFGGLVNPVSPDVLLVFGAQYLPRVVCEVIVLPRVHVQEDQVGDVRDHDR